MANFYLHEAPCKNVDECMRRRELTDDLYTWSRRVKTFGGILLILILVSGLIISWSAAYTEVVSRYYTDTEFDFSTFLIGMIPYAIYALIEYCAYKIISLVLSAISGVYQHSAESAALKEYEIRKREGTLN